MAAVHNRVYIVKLVTILPQHFPVLAATATATETVAQDVALQIGGGRDGKPTDIVLL